LGFLLGEAGGITRTNTNPTQEEKLRSLPVDT